MIKFGVRLFNFQVLEFSVSRMGSNVIVTMTLTCMESNPVLPAKQPVLETLRLAVAEECGTQSILQD